MYLIYLMIFFIIVSTKGKAQNLHQIGDTIEFNLDGYKEGKIQWQYSIDNQNWIDVINGNKEHLISKIDKTAFYRAKITNTNCNKEYISDKSFIDTNENLGLKIAGYTTDIILCKGLDGTLYCTRSGDFSTFDRDGKNKKVIYNFASNGYYGYNINNAKVMPSGTIIVALTNYKQKLIFLRSTDPTYSAWELVNDDWNGQLLYHGWDVSPDGTLIVGEYPTNDNILTVRLWKVTNDGRDWVVIRTFNGRQGTFTTEKQIFHIHTVCYDNYSGLFWIGTGDKDSESSLWTYDNASLTLVGAGSQLWRICSLSFTKDYVFWGTDGGIWINGKTEGGIFTSGHFQCYMLRMNRISRNMELLNPTTATMFNCESANNGFIPIFIGCGNPNAIYISRDGSGWKNVLNLKLNPALPNSYSWFYNFVNNGDGRIYGYITGIMREDTNEPLTNGGTVILDITY